MGGFIILTVVVLLNNPRNKVAVSPTPTEQYAEPTSTLTPPPFRKFGADPLSRLANPQSRLIERVKHRETLTDSDISARDTILAPLKATGKKSGIVYESDTIFIEYISSADLFQIEIMSKNIEEAKAEAVTWFTAKGFSQDGICKYPVSFYLNYETKLQIGKAADSFNPLPPGC